METQPGSGSLQVLDHSLLRVNAVISILLRGCGPGAIPGTSLASLLEQVPVQSRKALALGCAQPEFSRAGWGGCVCPCPCWLRGWQ